MLKLSIKIKKKYKKTTLKVSNLNKYIKYMLLIIYNLYSYSITPLYTIYLCLYICSLLLIYIIKFSKPPKLGRETKKDEQLIISRKPIALSSSPNQSTKLILMDNRSSRCRQPHFLNRPRN